MKPDFFRKEEQSLWRNPRYFADQKESLDPEYEKAPTVPVDIFFENKRVFYSKDKKVKKIDDKIRKIAESLVPGYDFTQCSFLIEDSDTLNAFILRDGKKSFVVFTKELISFVKNEDEFAYILGHELTHHLLADELGGGENSRIEEGIADLKPIELLHNAGYDARQAYEISKRISPIAVSALFDVHGKFSDRVLMVKNLVAGIDNKVGGLKNEPKDFQMGALVSDMNFQSFFQKAEKNEAYQNKSIEGKIKFLIKHVNSLSPRHTSRIEDYEKLLTELPALSEKEMQLFARLAEVFTDRFESTENQSAIKKVKSALVFRYETAFEKVLQQKEGSIVELARVLVDIPEWYKKIGTFGPIRNLVSRQQMNDREDLRMFNMVVDTYGKKFEEKLYYAVSNRYVSFLDEEAKKGNGLDERYIIITGYLEDIPSWVVQEKGIPGVSKVFKHLLDGTPEAKSRYEKWIQSLNGSFMLSEAHKVLAGDFEDPESLKVLPKKEIGRKLSPLGVLDKDVQVEKLKSFLNSLLEQITSLGNFIDKEKNQEELLVKLEESRGVNIKILEDIKRGMSSLAQISPDEAKVFFPEFLEKFGSEISSMVRLEVGTGRQYLQIITSLPAEVISISQKLVALRAADLVTVQMEKDLEHFNLGQKNEDWPEDNLGRMLEQRGFNLNLESCIYDLFHMYPKSVSEIISFHNEIKKADEEFANDFLRVQFLNILQKYDSKINVLELVIALDENPTQLAPMLIDADEFIAKALTYQIANEHRWPSNVFDLTLFYKILNRKNFFPTGNDARERMANKIIDLTQILEVDYGDKIEILMSLYQGPRISDPIVRNKHIGIFVSLVEKQYGKDDGSSNYLEKIEAICAFVERINIIDRYALSQAICDAVVSQERTSFRFRDAVIGEGISRESLIENSVEVMKREFYYELFEVYPNKEKIVTFLLTPFSLETAQDIANDVARVAENTESQVHSAFIAKFGDNHSGFIKKKATDFAALYYHNFWASSFLVRTAIIDKMIHEHDQKEGAGELESFRLNIDKEQKQVLPAWERGYSLITEKLVPQEDPYKEKINLFLRSYLDVIPEYQKSLFLCALMTAQQKSQETSKFETGKVLANILELLGPAEIKAGQVAHSFPDTPEEIANGLRRLKSKANIPTRWEIFELRNKLVPQEIISRIVRTEQIHAGSINITAHVIENDGSEKILIFERENAKERIDEGFTRLSHMAENIGGNEMRIIKEILDEARKLTRIEIDEESNLEQSKIAFDNYNGIVLEGPIPFKIKTPTMYFYGDRYKYMDYMKGLHFNDLPENTIEEKNLKQAVAKAYLALEFSMTLSGKQTDRDRHGDNIRIDTNSQQIEIGLYDFGGLDLDLPSGFQKEILFDVFYGVFSSANKSGVLNVISDSIDTMIANHVTEKSFLRRQEQRFLALGDYLKMLDFKDLQDVFFTAIKMDNLDPVFQEKFLKMFGADKNIFNELPSSMKISKKLAVEDWKRPKKILVSSKKEKLRVIPQSILKNKK